MKPCAEVLWNWDFLSSAFSWIYFTLAQWFHSGRYSWRKMHKWAPSAGERCIHSDQNTIVHPSNTQAGSSLMSHIYICHYIPTCSQTNREQKMTQCAHQQCGGKYWVSENQRIQKENSKGRIQFSAWYFRTKTSVLFTKHPQTSLKKTC